ncbi:MAG: DUF1489 family protein [Pikeienuella sp.]
MAKLHLLKLCVGVESPEELAVWQARRMAAGMKAPNHTTRMWPRRAAELLDGGSLYWVMKGRIASRQRITSLDEVIDEEGIRRCKIVMSPELIRVASTPKRAFQGWRYLTAEDAPRDLGLVSETATDLPAELSEELARIGVI